LRLSRYFGIDAGYWMRLQLSYEPQLRSLENREAIRRIRKGIRTRCLKAQTSSCGRPGSGQSIWKNLPRGWSVRS